MEFFFDKADFPCLVATTEVFELVVAIDVDQVVLLIFCVVVLLLEPLVEGVIFGLVEVPLENQRTVALGITFAVVSACHRQIQKGTQASVVLPYRQALSTQVLNN